MVDNLILPLEIEDAIVLYSYIPVLPLLGHSCWSRVHDGLQCRASLPSPLVGCLTSIYINCLRVVLLKPSSLMAFGARFTNNESNCISIASQSHLNCRSWARATTNTSKDDPGSKLMRRPRQPWEPTWKSWFVHTLNKFINTDLCSVPFGLSDAMFATGYTARSQICYLSFFLYFVQSMAYETTSRWSRL